MKELLRQIPPVHELQKHKEFMAIMGAENVDEKALTELLKNKLSEIRVLIANGNWFGSLPGTSDFTMSLFSELKKDIKQQFNYRLKRVINATGTVLHTNLGRARLSEEAINHVIETARSYSNLEYKLDEGERGSRHSHIEEWITRITGAEAAMVVNNNAAAVYLVLRALAKDKEVIVSRGQLVEIGGSFRISSIMEESGAKLVEVGTTNKTHLYDYENAINPETAIIMKVHTSNFKTIGFTESVETEELVHLKSNHSGVLFYEDLGSGVLYDLKNEGVGEEPFVSEIIQQGADLVSFSGDKLLGGPQAGIIAGKKQYIEILKRHQLARVLRVDKMTLAALEGTLASYLKGNFARESIPAVRDILQSEEILEMRAHLLLSGIQVIGKGLTAEIIKDTSAIGGGTMPGVEIPTIAVAVQHTGTSAASLHSRLRKADPPVVARVKNELLILDTRTITDEEAAEIITAFDKIF
ncbi:L-seryl-tRNA(Sec) selenium transferase [Peribacillus saganii]|uniref:L-seryl-tRNA(Sec) selenium transferase n=1 Tax=Peribacillus saganii TaxID=2303992 RepID=A0A372LRN9_9BACI|nr:L-seryl-tRNA(Sec) selenium transferase [Peribacillus saganii]RFU70452.1 L-seryl-tRNA(Sec) selenium transferase [Peribacillus saganii]